jgi:hypothetical protein
MRLQHLTATPHPAGNRIDLSWVNPDPAQYPGVRVVRRERTHPLSPDDGIVVVDGLDLPFREEENGARLYRVTDAGLKGETVYYYTLFPYVSDPQDAQIDRHNQTAALATSPYNMVGQMADLLPAVYHRYDTVSSSSGTATAEPGPLRRFLELPGAQLDLLYSFARAAFDLYNLDKVEGRLLPLLAQWIGWDTNFQLDIATQRNEIRNAPAIYKTIGIIPTVEATVKRMLGWESRAKEFVHNVFMTNAPEKLNIWTHRRDTAGAWHASAEPLSLDFAYDGRPMAVYDEDGMLWLFYHTLRNDRWDIWYKSLTVFTIASSLQNALDGELVSADLQQAFQDAGFSLSWRAVIEKEDGQWSITDRENEETYVVRSEDGQLNVYRWAPSRRLTSDATVDRHPSVVCHDGSLYVFWDSYDTTNQTWRVKYRTRSAGEWSATATFGDDQVDRQMPAIAFDHTDHMWAFWLERDGSRWRLKYQRRIGDEWDMGSAHTFPSDNGDDPRVERDLFVLFQPPELAPDATARMLLFWSRKVAIGGENQTRWQIAYRVATALDPGELTWFHSWSPAYPDHLSVDFTTIPIDISFRTWHVNRPPDWSVVYTLPAIAQTYDMREPAAFFNISGALELFWSSDSDGSWSIWHSVLQDVAPPNWQAPAQVTTGPFSQRGPYPISILSGTLLFHGSNQSLRYASKVYRATETLDARYAGSTTVAPRNLAKLTLRGQYEDFQTYVYDVGKGGVRTERDWYARDTVGIYLNAETEDQQIILRNRNLITNVLRQFLPIQIQIVFIIPIVTRERIYTYDFPSEQPQRLIAEHVSDSLDGVTSDLYSGLRDEYTDAAPGWVWMYSWSEIYPGLTTVDVTAIPINTSIRTWHIGLEPGG